MPNFTAGTSFTDGVTNDVTAAKLNALIADAVPTSSLSLNSTTGTISLFSSGTGTAATPAIQPTGDTNTGIFFPAADTIAFSEGGAEAVRIDSSGQVGIGTTSPSSQLHINNSAAATIRLQSSSNTCFVEGNNSYLDLHGGSQAIRMVAGSAEALRIDSSGNVGIGTSSPATKLNVSGSNEVFRITGTNSYGAVTDGTVTAYLGAVTGGDAGAFAGTNSNHYYALRTNNTERLRIDSSGNVGIGTASPATKLSVVASANSGINVTNGTMTGIFFNSSDTSIAIGSTSNHPVAFLTNNAERLRIDASGFLMAGATSQEGAVTFKFNAPNQDLLKIRNTSSTDAFGVTILMDATTANTQSMIRCFANTSTLVFNIAGNGNVTNTNNSYAAISDIKLKENIEDAASQWSDIKTLNVRKFSFKNDESHSRFLGLIAQEVEQISPNLVEEYKDYEQVDVVGENGETKKENRPTGTTTKSVKYSILYMKAVKALQEAMERIEALESKVTALEAA